MKSYRDYPLGSISMHDSPELRRLLRDTISSEGIVHVVETGTYEGRGSTRFVAEAFPSNAPPRTFRTIEASWRNWRRAKRNLRPFSFITPLWGHSLDLRAALEFVEHDECIRYHDRFPNTFIDDTENPVAFYSGELKGELGGIPRGHRRLLFAVDRIWRYGGEDLLRQSLRLVSDENPLIVLDSAGGTGWLEFQTVLDTMQDRRFILLLDDVHHLKHFRSLAHVRGDSNFAILGLDERHGWLLAAHRDQGRAPSITPSVVREVARAD